LVSSHYLNSDEILKIQLPHIRSLIDSQRARVIYVILEKCPWRAALASPYVPSVVIPREDRALAEGTEEQVKDDLHELTQEVRRALQVTEKQTPPPIDDSTATGQWFDQQTINRFSKEALAVLSRANRIRDLDENPMMSTRHLILAFRELPAEKLNPLFDVPKLDLAIIIEGVLETPDIPRNEAAPPELRSFPPISDNVRRALTYTVRKADDDGSKTVELAHVLFGLLSATDNPRVKKLNTDGLTPEKVKFPGKPAPDASQEQQIEEEANESIEISSISDAPAEKDELGFKPYVEAISRFLQSPHTKPPLTLSIEGEWGSGKSSFMLQLKNAVTGEDLWARLKKSWVGANGNTAELSSKDTSSKRRVRLWEATKKRRRFTVQFNPWRHDKEDSLWAAFALEFLRQVSRERFLLLRWWGSAKLFVAHYTWKKGWLEAARVLVVWLIMAILIVGLPLEVLVHKPRWAEDMLAALSQRLNSPRGETNPPKSQELPSGAEKRPAQGEKEKPEDRGPVDFDPLLRILLRIGGPAAYFAVILTIWLKVKGIVGNPLEINLKKYLRSPDYEGRVAFVEQFHEDFRKIVDAYAGKEKVFVFIDDLDRCEVPKAAELMKAVNLLIADDPRLIFILGMDREKVAAGLAVKYEKMLPYLIPEAAGTSDDTQWKRRAGLEFGQAFLQKFIQLPFRVPEPNLENYQDFIETVSAPARSNATSMERIASGIPAPVDSEANEVVTETAGTPEVAQANASAQIPIVPLPTPAQTQVRRERELQFQGDSDKIRAIALMYAQTLGTNPRRMKQFINLFRLQAYIANEIGLLDIGHGGTSPVTLEQLGKFVAITLRWPALLADFAEESRLLGKLEELVISGVPGSTDTLKRWLSERRMQPFLTYGMQKQREEYTLSNPSLYQLLHICPQRVRVSQSAKPTMPEDLSE